MDSLSRRSCGPSARPRATLWSHELHTSAHQPLGTNCAISRRGDYHSVKIACVGNTDKFGFLSLCILSLNCSFFREDVWRASAWEQWVAPALGRGRLPVSLSVSVSGASKFSPELGEARPDPEGTRTHSRPPGCHRTQRLPVFQNLWEDRTGVPKVVTGRGPPAASAL